jgi:general secretion pathway protein B
MSFILDALKKSETERQQQTGAEFSSVPSSSGEPQSFKWLWILALLLLVNVAVLLGVLLRPDRAPDVPVPVESAPVEPAPVEPAPVEQRQPTFEQRVAEAKQNQPAPQLPAADPAPVREQPAEVAVEQSTSAERPRLTTIDELRLDGSLQLPALHLDIHVFADDPAERFVFINMTKYRENSQLDEGPVVTEITTDGVILEHQGRTFLLPRE